MINYKNATLAFLSAILISILLGLVIIPILKKLKAGQTILKYVDKHAGKSGTATMGGFIFALATLIAYLIFASGSSDLAYISLTVAFSFLVVGFLDDFIKVKSGKNEGLTAKQKILFQTAISLVTALFVYLRGYGRFFVPFINLFVDFGVFGIVLVFFVFLATTNCVNLIDGLDGLAAGVSYVYTLILGIIISIQAVLFKDDYTNSAELGNLALLLFVQSGSLIGFLFYNTFSAKIFMGDTGSLYLGGFIAVTGILSGNTLFIPILGIMFVLTGISVIIQVLYFKRSGRRIFLMAPLHHHFEYKGYSEGKIAFVYKLVTLVVGIICILTVM